MFAVLRQRNFTLLWTARLVSRWGDALIGIVLPLYVFQLTGSALNMGLMLLTEMLPAIVLGSIAGVFVDRWYRRRIMITSDLLRMGIILFLLLVHSRQQIWLVYLVTFSHACIAQFFVPASGALVPELVSKDDLIDANRLVSLTDNLVTLVGPMMGGALFQFGGMSSAIWLDSATFLFSALMVVRVRLHEAGNKQESVVLEQAAPLTWRLFWREWTEGLQLIAGEQVLLGLLLCGLMLSLAEGIMNPLWVIFLRTRMHADPLGFGLFIASQGIGPLIGIWLVDPVSKRVRPVLLIGGTIALVGIDVLIINRYPILLLGCALLAGQGIFTVGLSIGIQTLLQLHTEARSRGRVFASLSACESAIMLLGIVLSSTLGDRLGLVLLFNVAGLCYLLSTVPVFALLRGATLGNWARRSISRKQGTCKDVPGEDRYQ